MPLRVLNLDDLTWEDLTAEARSLIPSRSHEWTNHNPSDPGITLVELLAYVTENLMYELNRISTRNTIAFLRLLHGPGWKPKPARLLAEEKRAAVIEMRRPHRAITAEDFEQLALAVNETLDRATREKVARAKCVFQRNLEIPGRAAQIAEAPGHVSVVIVPTRRSHPTIVLLRTVKHALELARLLTTRIHVVRPRFVTVNIRVTVVPQHGVDWDSLRDEAIARLERFFDPLEGGPDGKGWPFGKSVYVSEVYRLLSQIPGVDYVIRSKHADTGADLDELVVAPSEERRRKWNKLRELEAIHVLPDELVSIWVGESDITIGPQ